jgi:hypothetical protein|tara:strand:+ start:361 stop:699 length:339 start_codon:yes stop_codon:yes gene_type:complete
MINLIRDIVSGIGLFIAGISMLVIQVLGLFLHLYTIILAYGIGGLFAAFISFIAPFFSQLYWIYYFKKLEGLWINSFSFIVLLYVGLVIVLYVIVFLSGLGAAISQTDKDKE